MRTGLDMVVPTLVSAGACLTIREEEVAAEGSVWHVFAHRAGAATPIKHRSDEAVTRLLAQLEAAPLEDERLARLMAFDPGSGAAAVRKTSVSAVLRDEKRAAQLEAAGEMPKQRAEIERLPRFMQQQRMTGAQIGTAFHRMVRMLDLDKLSRAERIEQEIGAQMSAMLEDGVVTQAEAKAVPARLLVSLFASPLGVRMLKSANVQREWAFTYRRQTKEGQVQLLQGVIDCCFEEDGAWVLVDYKTDSAADVQGAMERHGPQLEIYAQALGDITGMPVRERILFLVRAGMGYSV